MSMKNYLGQKRKYCLAVGIVIGVGLVVTMLYFVTSSFVLWNDNVIELAYEYEAFETQSDDGEYELQVYREDENNMACATFRIVDLGRNSVVFQAQEKYRTWDLKSIGWEKDTSNILVKTGDMGTTMFLFIEGTWKKQ